MDGTRPLTEYEYNEQARPAFAMVFRNADAFDEPVQPWVEGRALLYAYPYRLFPEQLTALAEAVRDIGDDGLYVTATEDLGSLSNDPKHWVVTLDNLEGYHTQGEKIGFLYMENAIYSPKGTWGLLFSQESHVVAAGTHQFIERLFYHQRRLDVTPFKTIEEEIPEFLRRWMPTYPGDPYGKPEWVPRLLTHLYGRERAETFLREAGWFDSKP